MPPPPFSKTKSIHHRLFQNPPFLLLPREIQLKICKQLAKAQANLALQMLALTSSSLTVVAQEVLIQNPIIRFSHLPDYMFLLLSERQRVQQITHAELVVGATSPPPKCSAAMVGGLETVRKFRQWLPLLRVGVLGGVENVRTGEVNPWSDAFERGYERVGVERQEHLCQVEMVVLLVRLLRRVKHLTFNVPAEVPNFALLHCCGLAAGIMPRVKRHISSALQQIEEVTICEPTLEAWRHGANHPALGPSGTAGLDYHFFRGLNCHHFAALKRVSVPYQSRLRWGTSRFKTLLRWAPASLQCLRLVDCDKMPDAFLEEFVRYMTSLESDGWDGNQAWNDNLPNLQKIEIVVTVPLHVVIADNPLMRPAQLRQDCFCLKEQMGIDIETYFLALPAKLPGGQPLELRMGVFKAPYVKLSAWELAQLEADILRDSHDPDLMLVAESFMYAAYSAMQGKPVVFLEHRLFDQLDSANGSWLGAVIKK